MKIVLSTMVLILTPYIVPEAEPPSRDVLLGFCSSCMEEWVSGYNLQAPGWSEKELCMCLTEQVTQCILWGSRWR